jgi:tetraacyldisaccharide 4'-kinase
LNQEDYRKLICGEKAGLGAAVVRPLLRAAAAGYLIIVAVRNFLYSKGRLKTYRVNAAVISVGNITVGGTGKTPLVVWLCKFLLQKEFRCAVLTRGYKTHTKERGTRDEGRETRIDEPAILAEGCPQAKVIVNPDRVAAATEAVNKFRAKVLIMDDGFQHRRLHRDIDIVTIDATCPFGCGRVLPAGLLREPVTALKRADVAVITRCDQVCETELSETEKKLRQINPDMIIARSVHKPICARFADGKEIGIEQLKGRKIFAFCGIGNPQAFLDTIKNIRAEAVGSKIYDDHYHYTIEDIADIEEQAGRVEAELILTTQKDWTRIIGDFRFPIADFQSPIPFAYLAIELKFISGEDKITQLLEDTLTGKMQKRNDA